MFFKSVFPPQNMCCGSLARLVHLYPSWIILLISIPLPSRQSRYQTPISDFEKFRYHSYFEKQRLVKKNLGTDGVTKMDEFSEKFQTAFEPPSSFSENHITDVATKVRMFIMAGLLCVIWSYFPWDACSTTVQHGNWLKTYPKKILLYHFHAEKALFKGPKSAI